MGPGYMISYWMHASGTRLYRFTLRPRQNGRKFPDIFKPIFLKENISISMTISRKFVSKGPINNTPALVQIMARCRPGDKPLSEPMMVILLTHICVTRPQWVNPYPPEFVSAKILIYLHFLALILSDTGKVAKIPLCEITRFPWSYALRVMVTDRQGSWYQQSLKWLNCTKNGYVLQRKYAHGSRRSRRFPWNLTC